MKFNKYLKYCTFLCAFILPLSLYANSKIDEKTKLATIFVNSQIDSKDISSLKNKFLNIVNRIKAKSEIKNITGENVENDQRINKLNNIKIDFLKDLANNFNHIIMPFIQLTKKRLTLSELKKYNIFLNSNLGRKITKATKADYTDSEVNNYFVNIYPKLSSKRKELLKSVVHDKLEHDAKLQYIPLIATIRFLISSSDYSNEFVINEIRRSKADDIYQLHNLSNQDLVNILDLSKTKLFKKVNEINFQSLNETLLKPTVKIIRKYYAKIKNYPLAEVINYHKKTAKYKHKSIIPDKMFYTYNSYNYSYILMNYNNLSFKQYETMVRKNLKKEKFGCDYFNIFAPNIHYSNYIYTVKPYNKTFTVTFKKPKKCYLSNILKQI